MPIECEMQLRYCANMTTNPHAQPLFEFIENNGLSLNKIALAASISHGTLRAFRDVEGRKLNKTTAIAIAQALHQLTSKPVDASTLFGEQFTKAEDASINAPVNTNFSMLLQQKKLQPWDVQEATQVPMSWIMKLLHGGEIPHNAASRIANFLCVPLSNIGANEHAEAGSSEQNADLPRDYPIRRLLMVRAQHGTAKHRRSEPNYPTNENFHELIVSDEVIGTTVRPPSLLESDDAYALYVPDSQMWPRLEEGDLIYIDPNWPPKPNDDVVVFLRGEQRGQGFLAHFISRDAREFIFSCYTADGIWAINKDEIIALHKILRGRELILR